MKTILLLISIVISLPLFAIEYNWSKWEEQCGRERTQLELNQCAYQQFLSSNNQLNVVYEKTINSLTLQKQKKLRTEQRLWLNKRDSSCLTQTNEEAAGGSIWPMLYQLCRAGETDRRIKQLRKLISH
ncbi:lysozyme inhibitor LprI family protein [Microbulbifer sp. JMSA008]|uniref:lysozyme inhibitor LprI family protein n=1 Tax=unclassified Microbulbifer TaxID=2619833 RepID=UPI00403A9041